MQKILVVEDEPVIADGLKKHLDGAGYLAVVARDGVEALALFDEAIDLVLLDVMLPKIDGYGVLEVIRQRSEVPILMITALESEESQMKAFDLRIDDYVTKPFSMNILLRKIEAVLRRATVEPAGDVLEFKDLVMNPKSGEVMVAGKNVQLTAKEFELLRLFMLHPNQIFSREQMLERVWGYDFGGGDAVVTVHLKNLRKKIGDGYLQTMRGMGYKLG